MEHTHSGALNSALTRLTELAFDAVLFDMDGTLIDSTKAVERSWKRWAEEEGLSETFGHADHGRPARAVVETLVAPERVEESLARVISIETMDAEGIRALEGAAELLDAIPSNRCAIVTSCTRGLAEARLQAAGINPPPVLISFDDISQGKPDPEGFLLAARRLGVDPSRCLVVEDTPAGLAAAKAAGCTALAVTGTVPAAHLDADFVLPGLSGLKASRTPDGLRLSINS
jgi:mannitol-1-/sugar-/sorbitol-6-phosphatase